MIFQPQLEITWESSRALRFPESSSRNCPISWILPICFSIFLVSIQGHFGTLSLYECPSWLERGEMAVCLLWCLQAMRPHRLFPISNRKYKTECGSDLVVLKSPPGLYWGFVCSDPDGCLNSLAYCIWRGYPQKPKVNHHLQTQPSYSLTGFGECSLIPE